MPIRFEHHIDASWNEVWTVTTQLRHLTRVGDRLIHTTEPALFPHDGEISVNRLVWEKPR